MVSFWLSYMNFKRTFKQPLHSWNFWEHTNLFVRTTAEIIDESLAIILTTRLIDGKKLKMIVNLI